MKKAIFVVLLLLPAILTQSQIPVEPDDKKKKALSLGTLYLSALLTSLPGESESMDGSLTGFQFGVRIDVLEFNDQLGLHAEANYSQQGGKYTMPPFIGEPGGGDPGMPGRSGKLRLNYINFPITASYESEGGFVAEAGIQPGLLVGAKDKIDGNTTNVKDGFNKFDFGVVAGVGYQFKNGIGVGFRAVPGLTNVNKEQQGFEVPKDRNLTLSLRASYSF